MEKTNILMNKPFYLGLSVLELSKMSIYECWYDYVKSKHDENAKWCYMDTYILIVYIKLMIFIMMLQKMSKLHLILQTMNCCTKNAVFHQEFFQ